MRKTIEYGGSLIREFFYRIYDDYRLWKLQRDADKIMENVEHQLVKRKNILKEIKKIKEYYEIVEDIE